MLIMTISEGIGEIVHTINDYRERRRITEYLKALRKETEEKQRRSRTYGYRRGFRFLRRYDATTDEEERRRIFSELWSLTEASNENGFIFQDVREGVSMALTQYYAYGLE